MAVYIGVDFHARQQTISYLTTESGEVQQVVLMHDQPAQVRAFYEQFGGQQVIVGFESSGYAGWFEELLEEVGCEVWIGHASYIRQFARRRQKNDRRDADLILELLFSGDFPRIHRYSRRTREVLQQLRYRQRLPDIRQRPEIPGARAFRALRLRLSVHHRRQDRQPGYALYRLCR